MLPLLKAMGQDRVCVCVYVGGGHRTVPSAQCGLNLQHPLPPSATSTPYGRSLPPPRKKTLQNQQLLFGEMKSTMLNSPWGPFITHTHAPEASNLQKSANPPPPNKSPSESPPQSGALPPRYGATCRRTTAYGLATLSPHWSTELTNEKGGVCPALPPQPIARRRSSGLPGRADGQREAWPRGGSSRREANESGEIGVGGVSVGGTPSQWGARGAWPGFQRVRRRAAEQW